MLRSRCIATLMVELFDGHCQPLTTSEPTAAVDDQSEVRKADTEYWKSKLAEVDGAPDVEAGTAGRAVACDGTTARGATGAASIAALPRAHVPSHSSNSSSDMGF